MSEIQLTAPVRRLSATDLGVTVGPSMPLSTSPPEISPLDADDPILLTTKDLLTTFGGVIFVGPPGTSKSWYAHRVAVSLVEGDLSRVRFVQFHPSYQYEDFVEGYVPEEGGFALTDKHFLEMCDKAKSGVAVLVIDELSRGDPGRVFGEALTYIERTKRGLQFNLASGNKCVVPEGLVILATMNPLDRGVDEVDAALERRFAKISLDPDPELLSAFVVEAGMPAPLRERLIEFFSMVNARSQRNNNPFAALGHTYFHGVADEDGLRRVWEHQLKFHFVKAFRLEPDGRAQVFAAWDRVMGVATATADPKSTAEQL